MMGVRLCVLDAGCSEEASFYHYKFCTGQTPLARSGLGNVMRVAGVAGQTPLARSGLGNVVRVVGKGGEARAGDESDADVFEGDASVHEVVLVHTGSVRNTFSSSILPDISRAGELGSPAPLSLRCSLAGSVICKRPHGQLTTSGCVGTTTAARLFGAPCKLRNFEYTPTRHRPKKAHKRSACHSHCREVNPAPSRSLPLQSALCTVDGSTARSDNSPCELGASRCKRKKRF